MQYLTVGSCAVEMYGSHSRETAFRGHLRSSFGRRFGVDLGGVFDIIPISRPNAQNLKSPASTITLHPRNHAAHHARS